MELTVAISPQYLILKYYLSMEWIQIEKVNLITHKKMKLLMSLYLKLLGTNMLNNMTLITEGNAK
jgi:hypothetical protein